ncbi:MAG: YdcF family protein [Gammaproteobacteria bacterium]|nr:YdcF family protein [Gammaproteobacteria bacterium]
MPIIKKIVLLLIGLIVIILATTEFVYWFANTSYENEPAFSSCSVLILGYPSNPDGNAHPVQKLRVKKGVEIFNKFDCEQLLTTGGALGSRFVQAEVMASVAIEMGVPKQQIVLEGESRNTWENIGCAMSAIKPVERLFIVSDSLHSHRGKQYLCRQNPELCEITRAVGGYEAFSLLTWKVPALYHEIKAWWRDYYVYGNKVVTDENTCTVKD